MWSINDEIAQIIIYKYFFNYNLHFHLDWLIWNYFQWFIHVCRHLSGSKPLCGLLVSHCHCVASKPLCGLLATQWRSFILLAYMPSYVLFARFHANPTTLGLPIVLLTTQSLRAWCLARSPALPCVAIVYRATTPRYVVPAVNFHYFTIRKWMTKSGELVCSIYILL